MYGETFIWDSITEIKDSDGNLMGYHCVKADRDPPNHLVPLISVKCFDPAQLNKRKIKNTGRKTITAENTTKKAGIITSFKEECFCHDGVTPEYDTHTIEI